VDTNVVVSLVGLVGVAFAAAWTQWRADVRADKERASNRSLDEQRRKEENERQELEHVRDLEERWRDERRAAHARLLALIAQINDDVFKYVMDTEDLDDDDEPRQHEGLIAEAHKAELWEALGVVSLIATDAAARAATKAVESLDWLSDMASTPWGMMRLLRKHWQDYEQALPLYRKAARQELGVAAPRQAPSKETTPQTSTPGTSGVPG
jgi:hypothetical protein